MAEYTMNGTFFNKELTTEETRTKKLVKKAYGKLNDSIIDEISSVLFITRDSAIDLLEEGTEGYHHIQEYKELAIWLNTSVDYLLGITDEEKPYPYNDSIK